MSRLTQNVAEAADFWAASYRGQEIAAQRHYNGWLVYLNQVMQQHSAELIGHSGSTGSFAFHNPERNLLVAGTLNQMDKPNRPFRLMTRVINLVE